MSEQAPHLPLPYAEDVAIQTGFYPTTPLTWVVWNQEQQDLVDITSLIGWTPPEKDGVLYVRTVDGVQPVYRGWAVRKESGQVGVASPAVVASWRTSTSESAPAR
jgi:hypothetical protein